MCLSGGGVRAASFAMGVLQTLQARRGLLYGERAADHLSVVSGGSYIGATQLLNATAGSVDGPAPPLADASPEARWVVQHGRYLLRMLIPMALAFVVNVAAVVALFLWAGAMLAAVAAVSGVAVPADAWARWALAAAALLAGRVILLGLYKDGGWKRTVLPLAGTLALVPATPSLVATAREAPIDLLGIPVSRYWVLGIAGFAVAAAFWQVGRATWWRRPPTSVAMLFVGTVLVAIPRIVGFVGLAYAATELYDVMRDGLDNTGGREEVEAVLWFMGALAAGLLFSGLAHHVSLHRLYRAALTSCFGVRRRRDGDGVEPAGAIKLSDLDPARAEDPGRRFPRLLICATANVLWSRNNSRRRQLLRFFLGHDYKYTPFVFSHDYCGAPDIDHASFPTRKLEQIDMPGTLPFTREPLVSVMTAVASTGAAVSPSMGRMTIEAVRPLIAVLNVRLGRWLPNPLSARVRHDVEAHQGSWNLFKRKGIGGGYDEFVPELFGLHHGDAARVYVSDGGHYDNLGLLALLHARCAEIWCVDSASDRKGEAGQLRSVLGLAKSTLDVDVDLEPDVFARTGGRLGASHAVGTIKYPGTDARGKLIVVKLGLTADSDSELVAYADSDRLFPYAPTFPFQLFGEARFEAYRKLGADSADKAITAAQPASDPAAV